MKFCEHCGAQMEDSLTLCATCGQESTPAQQEQPVDTTVAVLPAMEAPADPIAADLPLPAETEPKKKSKLPLIALIVVGALALIAAIGFFTNWFGLYTPMDKLALAFKRTLTAESFTVKGEDFDGEDFEVRVRVDKDSKKASAYGSGYGETYLAHDGKLYRSATRWSDIDEYNDEEVYGYYDNVMNEDGVQWNELAEKTKTEEYVDADKFNEFFATLYSEYLNDSTWAEETLGMEVDGSVYTFKPQTKDLCKDVIALVKEKGLAKGDYKDYIDDVENTMDDLYDQLDDVTIQVTLDGKYVSKIQVEVEINGDTYECYAEFSKINEAELTDEEIGTIIADVEKTIANDTCPECGDRKWGDDFCWNCYTQCFACNNVVPSSEALYGWSYFCKNCAGTCTQCGGIYENSYLTTHNGEIYCSHCLVHCSSCTSTIPVSQATEYDYNYYCDTCTMVCETCSLRRPIRNMYVDPSTNKISCSVCLFGY